MVPPRWSPGVLLDRAPDGVRGCATRRRRGGSRCAAARAAPPDRGTAVAAVAAVPLARPRPRSRGLQPGHRRHPAPPGRRRRRPRRRRGDGPGRMFGRARIAGAGDRHGDSGQVPQSARPQDGPGAAGRARRRQARGGTPRASAAPGAPAATPRMPRSSSYLQQDSGLHTWAAATVSTNGAAPLQLASGQSSSPSAASTAATRPRPWSGSSSSSRTGRSTGSWPAAAAAPVAGRAAVMAPVARSRAGSPPTSPPRRSAAPTVYDLTQARRHHRRQPLMTSY